MVPEIKCRIWISVIHVDRFVTASQILMDFPLPRNPSGPQLLTWPEFTRGSSQYLEIQPEPTVTRLNSRKVQLMNKTIPEVIAQNLSDVQKSKY